MPLYYPPLYYLLSHCIASNNHFIFIHLFLYFSLFALPRYLYPQLHPFLVHYTNEGAVNQTVSRGQPFTHSLIDIGVRRLITLALPVRCVLLLHSFLIWAVSILHVNVRSCQHGIRF